ncbi:MAG: phosphoribosyltransferase [Anaerolineae bacterium]|nr:MAG: phosphoribosyltransferase [Anaerolineae bacterium]
MFADRLDAGRQLGEELRLRGYRDEPAIVLAIPRGGVPVAHAVTQALGTPLEVIVPGKLRLPGEPETTFGAIVPDGTLLLNLSQVESLELEAEEIKRLAAETLSEMHRQMETYRGKRPPLDMEGKTAILVDDGLASGFTMLAAVRAVRCYAPARVVVAVPVSPFSAVDRLAPQVDDLVCLVERDDTGYAIAHAYTDLADLSDDQVCTFLRDIQTR